MHEVFQFAPLLLLMEMGVYEIPCWPFGFLAHVSCLFTSFVAAVGPAAFTVTPDVPENLDVNLLSHMLQVLSRLCLCLCMWCPSQ